MLTNMLVVELAGHRKELGEHPEGCSNESVTTAVVTIQDGFLGLPVVRGHRCEAHDATAANAAP